MNGTMTLALDFPDCRRSPLGRIDARYKLAALLGMAVLIGFLRTWPMIAAALGGSLLLLFLAKVPWRWFLPRLAGMAFFLGIVVLWLPFVPASDSIIYGPGVRMSPLGLERALVILGKGLAILILMTSLLTTATLPVTLQAARALRVPGLLIQLVLLTYRYVFVLADEFVRLRTALRVRGFRNRATVHSYRTVGQVAGTLVVRGHERAERVAQAMRCRGFAGEFQSLQEFRASVSDYLFLAALLGIALALLIGDLGLRSCFVNA